MGSAVERSVVFFAPTMAESHLRRILPLATALVRRGLPVHVYCDRTFRDVVERSGAPLRDIFALHTLADADSESTLMGCKHVSFAGHFGEEIAADVAELRPGLIVYDTFAVVARVVARILGVPAVNASKHDLDPLRYEAEMRDAFPVVVSERCEQAVELLRDRYGLADATPFSYLQGLSPDLNIYGEPRQWLPEERRPLYEPVAFYGSLPDSDPPAGGALPTFPGGEGRLRLYVSFGTVPWWWWPEHLRETLEWIASFLAGRDDLSAVISLGGSATDAAVEQLSRPNVAVERYVDQWRLLQQADAFVSHNGLNSTHEAIYHGVPLLSYPIFADQPDLARLSRNFGIALPLVETPRGELTVETFEAALAELVAGRESFDEALARAREWELDAIRGREAVHDRLVELLQA